MCVCVCVCVCVCESVCVSDSLQILYLKVLCCNCVSGESGGTL